MKTKVLISVGIITMFISSSLIAGPFGRGKGQKIKRALPMQGILLKELNLSQEQIAEIKKIQQEYQDKITEALNNSKSEREKYYNIFASDASVDAVVAQHAKLQEANQHINNLRQEILLKIREKLTPEQRKKIKEKIIQRYHKRYNTIDNF